MKGQRTCKSLVSKTGCRENPVAWEKNPKTKNKPAQSIPENIQGLQLDVHETNTQMAQGGPAK